MNSKAEEAMFNTSESYWLGKRRALHRVVKSLCDVNNLGLSAERYWERAREICAEYASRATQGETDPNDAESKFPGESAFRSYVSRRAVEDAPPGERERYGFQGDQRFLNALAIVALQMIDEQPTRLSGVPADRSILTTFRDDAIKRPTMGKGQGEVDASRAANALANIALRFIPGLGAHMSDSAARWLFGPDSSRPPHRRYYETYRFSTTPGRVDKSFTLLSLIVVDGLPVVTFNNFFDDGRGVARRTDGVALGFQRGVYLVGTIETGEAAKVIGLTYASVNQKVLRGGVMTTNNAGKMLLSKVLLKQTNVADSRVLSEMGRATIGSHARIDLIDELDEDDIESIRNRLDFALEEPISRKTKAGYVSCTQAEMVDIVNQKLRFGESPLFKYANRDDAFNPADDAHYTFNSALRVE